MTARAVALLASTLALAGCHDRYRVGGAADDCASTLLPLALPTGMQPDDVSHWAQPWRAAVATRPARALRDAVGYGIFAGADYDAVVPQLAAGGIARAKVFTHWANMDPAALDRPQAGFVASLASTLSALRAHGIRPSLTLASVPNWPAPAREDFLTLLAAADAGARTLRFDPGARIVAARTAVLGRAGTLDAAPLVVAVDSTGLATLSKPLRDPLPAGATRTLTFAVSPFFHPRQNDGSPQPAFTATLDAWRAYVAAIVALARQTLGDGAFDLDVGAPDATFLDVNRFYDDPVDRTAGDADATHELVVAASAAQLREAGLVAPGSPTVVVDAAHTTARASGLARADVVFDALDRTTSVTNLAFGEPTAAPGRPLDATGAVDGISADGRWRTNFTPRYDAYFPEQALAALTPRTLVWDFVARAATPGAPELRIASLSLGAGTPAARGFSLSDDQSWRLKAKAALRGVVSYAGVGATVVHLFGPTSDPEALVDPARAGGGEVLGALGRLSRRLAASGASTTPRSVALVGVSACTDGVQFVGDGTPRHPDLRDRDVVAAFPWQRDDGRIVLAAYVMTRDLLREQPRRRFTLTVSGLGAAGRAIAYDPLDDAEVPVTTRARGRDVDLDVDLVDWPILIEIDDS